jgi:hypothetical protein
MMGSALCPYREVTVSHGLLCYDPWLGQFFKVPKAEEETWCEGDFHPCPKLLSYEDKVHPGIGELFKPQN